MGFYDDAIVPALVDFACSLPAISKERARVAPEAKGVVLELGFGSGRNAGFYAGTGIEKLYALEPSAAMRRRAARRVASLPFAVEWLNLDAEEIPLGAGSVDTVLVTFALCTIPDVARALAGARRVLKPGGRLVFLEHGAAPDAKVRRFQDSFNSLWRRLAGGCNLNREPAKLIEQAGFAMEKIDRHYAKGAPKFAGYMTAGVARAP